MDHKEVRARIDAELNNISSHLQHRASEPACIKIYNEIFLEMPSIPRYETASAVITDGKTR